MADRYVDTYRSATYVFPKLLVPVTLVTPNPGFKVTVTSRMSRSYYSTLIGNHTYNISNGTMFGDVD